MEIVLTKLAVILQVCVHVSKPSRHNVVKMKDVEEPLNFQEIQPYLINNEN
jgi:hypothetical protein